MSSASGDSTNIGTPTRFQEMQGQPPVSNQVLPPSPPVSQYQTPTGPSQTTHPPITSYGYVADHQHPPAYNDFYNKGNVGYNPGPQVNQPQPWNQPMQANYQSNVVVSAQPQPTSSNVVFVNSVPQRNPSQALATASLVMAIFGTFCCIWSIFCSIPGIIFAAISLGNSTDPESAKTHARISMACTLIGWITSIILVLLYIAWIQYLIVSNE